MKIRQDELFWSLRYVDAYGRTQHTMPHASLEELKAFVETHRLAGTVCACAIIPDFEVEIEVKFPIEKSIFLGSGADKEANGRNDQAAIGGGGRPTEPEVSAGEDSSLRSEADSAHGVAGVDSFAASEEVLAESWDDM